MWQSGATNGYQSCKQSFNYVCITFYYSNSGRQYYRSLANIMIELKPFLLSLFAFNTTVVARFYESNCTVYSSNQRVVAIACLQILSPNTCLCLMSTSHCTTIGDSWDTDNAWTTTNRSTPPLQRAGSSRRVGHHHIISIITDSSAATCVLPLTERLTGRPDY